MVKDYLSRLWATTRGPLRLTAMAVRRQTCPAGSDRAAPALLSQAAQPATQLRRADADWRPEPIRIRVEIMASGPFESLRGVHHAVCRLQNDLVAAGQRLDRTAAYGSAAGLPSQHDVDPYARGPRCRHDGVGVPCR